jgi:hypothetical protein
MALSDLVIRKYACATEASPADGVLHSIAHAGQSRALAVGAEVIRAALLGFRLSGVWPGIDWGVIFEPQSTVDHSM